MPTDTPRRGPLEPYGDHFPSVDPSAYIHPRATLIGEVSVGPGSSVWPSSVLRGDDAPIHVGAETSIQDGSILHTTTGISVCWVGDRVTVGHRVILHGCRVEDFCLIGMGAIILDNTVIGTGSVVGAGSLITANKVIPPNSLVLGSPAKVVRELKEAERAMIEAGWREYVERTAEYLARDAGE